MGRYRTIPQSFCFAKIQPPLHKGAFLRWEYPVPYGITIGALLDVGEGLDPPFTLRKGNAKIIATM